MDSACSFAFILCPHGYTVRRNFDPQVAMPTNHICQVCSPPHYGKIQWQRNTKRWLSMGSCCGQLLNYVQLLHTHELQLTRVLCPWDSPGKNTGMGSNSLLQAIFPTQGSNTHLLHCRCILYHCMGEAPIGSNHNANGCWTRKKCNEDSVIKPLPNSNSSKTQESLVFGHCQVHTFLFIPS